MIWENLFNGLDTSLALEKMCVHQTLSHSHSPAFYWAVTVSHSLSLSLSQREDQVFAKTLRGSELSTCWASTQPSPHTSLWMFTCTLPIQKQLWDRQHKIYGPTESPGKCYRSSNPHPSIPAAPRALQNLDCAAVGNSPAQHRRIWCHGVLRTHLCKALQHEPLRGGNTVLQSLKEGNKEQFKPSHPRLSWACFPADGRHPFPCCHSQSTSSKLLALLQGSPAQSPTLVRALETQSPQFSSNVIVLCTAALKRWNKMDPGTRSAKGRQRCCGHFLKKENTFVPISSNIYLSLKQCLTDGKNLPSFRLV